MANRIDRFHQQRNATRNLLEWLAVAAASTVLAACIVTSARAAEPDDGLMLRPGIEHGIDPVTTPRDGWYRVTHKEASLQVQAVSAPVPVPGEEEAEAIDTRYIRVPGARIAEGRLPTVAFTRGALTPRIDHAYQLALGDTPFTLMVRNGLRNGAGVAYGGGAVYSVSLGEDSYSFHLEGGPGWETQILLAADIDSDGRPDFIVRIGDQEVLLLSSRAHMGLNPPAAVLSLMNDGC